MSAIRVVLLCGYVAGVLAAAQPFVNGANAMAFLLAIGGMVTACAVAWSDGACWTPRRVVTIVTVCAGAFGVGAWAAARAWTASLNPPLRRDVQTLTVGSPESPVVIEGRVASDAAWMDYGVSLLLEVDRIHSAGRWLPTQGRIALTVGGSHNGRSWEAWQKGRHLRVVAGLRAPPFYQNPGGSTEPFNRARRGTAWVGSVKSEYLVERLANGSWLDEVLAAVRTRTRRAIRRVVHEPTVAGILIAILIGDRGAVAPDVETQLQRAGTYHVIAISGGNIAIFVGMLSLGARLLRVPMRPSVLASVALVSAYGLVAGGAASVSRACLAAVVYLSGNWCDVRPRGLPVLWTAVMTLLLSDPLIVFDVGFQLTAAATGAILLAGELADGKPGDGPRSYGYIFLRSTILATVAADIAILPTVVSSFNRVTIAGIVLNLAALPLMTSAQVAGLAVVAADNVWSVGQRATAVVAQLSIRGLLWSAGLVNLLPWLSWRVPAPSPGAGALYWTCWVAWVLLRLHGQPRQEGRPGRGLATVQRIALGAALMCTWGVTTGADAFAWRIAAPPSPAVEGAGRNLLGFVFFDVGQGDATLVRFPSGRAWLVDAGGLPGEASFDMGDRVVAPALWTLGVRTLDVLAVTHANPDHAGGAPSIAAGFRPAALWEGIPVMGHALTERIHDAIPHDRHVAVRRGQHVHIEGVGVTVRHPPPPDWTRVKVRNDDSLVLEFVLGSVRVILPGDVSAGVERELASQFTAPANTLTILKLPHHGSGGSSSSDFINATKPALAVISSGRGNRFGHPAPGVLQRLAAAGIPTVGTSESGAIALNTDGDTVLVSSWTGRQWRALWSGPAPPRATSAPVP